MADAIATPAVLPPTDSERGKRFVLNVFWNWLGVGVGIVSGVLLSPYMIHKLGPEGYGVWALSFSVVENYWFLDLGFRSALVKYVAHYWALGELDKVQEVVNTAIAIAGATASLVFVLVAFGARQLDRFFQVSPEYRSSFFTLVLLISASWCFSAVFGLFGAGLESLQRFDYYNRILVITTTLRSPGTLLLLYWGYGLVEIGILVVASQILGYLLHFYYFRKVFPGYRMSLGGARLAMVRQMGSYGIHNFLGNVSTQLSNQGPAILIGHFLPAAFVGYFQIPVRLLQYTGEAVGRIGVITNSNAAELVAKGEHGALSQLAVYTNRYCVTLFLPLAILFYSHGAAFFGLWLPKAAAYASPLLPILLTSYLISVVGQFSSGMLLMGLARYRWYSRGLFVEALTVFGGLWLVLPRYGIVGAAWVTAAAMILNRGLFLPWLVSRVMNFKYLWFMNSIYTRPFLAALPVYALAAWLSATVLPGKTWTELLLVAVIVGCLYYTLAIEICLPPEHRALLKNWIGRKIARPGYAEQVT